MLEFRKVAILGSLGLLVTGAVALAQAGGDAPAVAPGMPAPITMHSRPQATGGEALYVVKCAMCHAPNGMGHGLLGRRIEVPDLEQRTDLAKGYVVVAARRGIGNMPAIPRGEVSDAELDLIAEHLASGTRAAGAAQ